FETGLLHLFADAGEGGGGKGGHDAPPAAFAANSVQELRHGGSRPEEGRTSLSARGTFKSGATVRTAISSARALFPGVLPQVKGSIPHVTFPGRATTGPQTELACIRLSAPFDV